MPVLRAWPSRAHAGSWTVSASLLAVAAVSPFERPLPGLAVAGLTFTSVELAVACALAVWAAILVRDRRLPAWHSPISAPAAALLVTVLITALVAPEFGGNSIRFFGRLLAAALVALLVRNVLTSPRLAGQLIATLLVVGAVVGAVAVLELAQVPAVMDGLRTFRPGFHVVGGQVRATSTLFYPTITSMYLEVVFALGLFWLLSESGRAPRSRTLLEGDGRAFLALTLVAAGIVATFTRAGLITMTLSLLCVGGLRYARHRRWDGGHRKLAALAAVIVLLVLVSRSPQLLVTRMSNEGSQDWYGATYEAPGALEMLPGGIYDVPVTLKNDGWLTWQSRQAPEFALAYHWLSAATDDIVVYDGLRTPFADAVEPGQTVTLQAQVRVPAHPGSYVLVWDVVHEHRTWLSTEGVWPGRTMVTVTGDAASAPLPTHGRMPIGTLRLPRFTLWKTALEIGAGHPLLGIGPDNFRNVYGRYLGLVTWDTRVHANNTYLEALVGMGLVGLCVVTWLLAATFAGIWKGWRAAPDALVPLFAATVAALMAIAVHGLVDSFMTFTPTYVIFALAAGLMFSPAMATGVDTPLHGGDTPLGVSSETDKPEGLSPQDAEGLSPQEIDAREGVSLRQEANAHRI